LEASEAPRRIESSVVIVMSRGRPWVPLLHGAVALCVFLLATSALPALVGAPYARPAAIALAHRPVVLGAATIALVALVLALAETCLDARPAIVAMGEGLFFPAWPGAERGRFVFWESLLMVEGLAPRSAVDEFVRTWRPPRPRFRHGQCRLRLTLGSSRRWVRGGGLTREWYCALDSLTINLGLLAEHEVIETVPARGFDEATLVDALRTLMRNGHLRSLYCDPDERYLLEIDEEGDLLFRPAGAEVAT
jgi:hypothetical protein